MFLKFALTLVLAMTSALSVASTVCAGDALYYKLWMRDGGANPPEGSPIGNLLIILNGETVFTETIYNGGGEVTYPRYQTRLKNIGDFLSQTSNEKIYKAEMILTRQEAESSEEIEVATDTVLCRETFYYYP